MSQNVEKPAVLLKQRARNTVDHFQCNAETILETDPALTGCLKRNEMGDSLWKARETPWCSSKDEEWTDHDRRELRSWIEKEYGWSPSEPLLVNAIEVVADRNRFHPIQGYLEGLTWDRIPRLDTWLSQYLGARDTPYTRAVGRKFLISAVARIIFPGCKADHVLTLEGPQGIGKSSTFRTLMPKEAWFVDTSIDLNNKDAYLSLKGTWILEFAELESLSRAAVARIKVFISSPIDSYRPPYLKSVIKVPRQCVFVATTNEQDYLQDDTGGRRFWPVRCGNDRIDLARIENVRDQLWAEALHAFREKETWYLGSSEEQLAKAEQADRRVPDYLEDRIRELVRDKDFVTLEGILRYLSNGRESLSVRSAIGKKVARILTHTLGWTKGRQLQNRVRVHGYFNPDSLQVTEDEMEQEDKERDEAKGSSGQLAESVDLILDGDFED